ncbi:hypothetical protein ACV1DR_22890, partial [Aeromonas jandaei]
MFHGVSALLIEILAGINQQDTPLLLSLRTPEITITQHLPRHLAEYCFRFNHRFDLKSMFVE